jgi:hypothetical protein
MSKTLNLAKLFNLFVGMLGKLDQPQADSNVKHPNVEQYRKNKDQTLQNLGVRSIVGTVATRYFVIITIYSQKAAKLNIKRAKIKFFLNYIRQILRKITRYLYINGSRCSQKYTRMFFFKYILLYLACRQI